MVTWSPALILVTRPDWSCPTAAGPTPAGWPVRWSGCGASATRSTGRTAPTRGAALQSSTRGWRARGIGSGRGPRRRPAPREGRARGHLAERPLGHPRRSRGGAWGPRLLLRPPAARSGWWPPADTVDAVVTRSWCSTSATRTGAAPSVVSSRATTAVGSSTTPRRTGRGGGARCRPVAAGRRRRRTGDAGRAIVVPRPRRAAGGGPVTRSTVLRSPRSSRCCSPSSSPRAAAVVVRPSPGHPAIARVAAPP